MFKFGCVALLAMACSAVVPAAHARGGFFVAGQAGQATYDDSGFDEDSADTRALSLGYRWQAGSIAQVGVEVGGGRVDEITQDTSFTGYYAGSDSYGMDTRYAHVGANARVSFGQDSRWFAIGRMGYMGYQQDLSHSYTEYQGGQFLYSGEDTFSEDGGGAYFGGGLGMDITPNFNVNVMVNGYAYSGTDYDGNVDEDTASTTTLGLELRF
ncbi:outer membrane beta-barrel protein [Lysobacter niastensis]|uniref:Outer membrane beta-barrel protein n=1 Tax=Lysobacter niastensis TaxID=380629 RepID=A0ABS0BG72_9GAMM|nr:outer membrane beta-barrel protein [Lysobacter niastensis]MBF6026055.1 outer membrane beta-barrel protein [Lysobacter niastensis]